LPRTSNALNALVWSCMYEYNRDRTVSVGSS